MSTYPIHSIDSAPQDSRPFLQGLQQSLGMLPNLAAAMAESPERLKGFLAVRQIYQGGTFSPAERPLFPSVRFCIGCHSISRPGRSPSPNRIW